LHFATVTRLLVELNRSLGHPALFSLVTRSLPQDRREALLQRHYHPYRNAVEADIEKAAARNRRVVHLSMHTFTPVLDGTTRRADIGLLYDPHRPGEVTFCRILQASLHARRPDLVVRRNYPYRGASDGFTTALRKRWPPTAYVGIEIEVNQRWPTEAPNKWQHLQRDLSQAIADTLAEFGSGARVRAKRWPGTTRA
jgi:predicted N-formylglutamate amidohydrolase